MEFFEANDGPENVNTHGGDMMTKNSACQHQEEVEVDASATTFPVDL